MSEPNRKHELLRNRILSRCEGSGTAWEKYEDCKEILKYAEWRGIIAGSDWDEWISLVVEALRL